MGATMEEVSVFSCFVFRARPETGDSLSAPREAWDGSRQVLQGDVTARSYI